MGATGLYQKTRRELKGLALTHERKDPRRPWAWRRQSTRRGLPVPTGVSAGNGICSFETNVLVWCAAQLAPSARRLGVQGGLGLGLSADQTPPRVWVAALVRQP